MRILIENVTIVTMDEEIGIIENGYVLTKGKKIEKVSKGKYEGAREEIEIINGRGYCIIPGLINCHTHAAMTLLRGYGEGLPLMRWLNEKIWPMESRFKGEHIEIGTQIACIEMLRRGTTTFNDMYFMAEEVSKVANDFNIRAVLGLPIIGEHWEEQLDYAIKFSKKMKSNSNEKELIKTMIAPHSPYTLSEHALKKIAQSAKDTKQTIHIHVSETETEAKIIKEKYKMTSCELLLKTGIFNNKVVAAHCVHLTDGDLEIIKNNNISPVYNPQSNMKLASGVARVAEMLESNINVCLGTDGTSSNNNLNMFEEMETGALLQKLWYKDAVKLDAYTTFKMATVNGAEALGYNDLGRIKEGYKADLVMLNMNKANMVPCYDIYSNIVFSADGSEVETVIINGKLIMNKGEFTEIDEEKLIFQCNKTCRKLI